MTDMTRAPILLEAVERPMSWGHETWLASTQSDGVAPIKGSTETLATLVRSRPEILGRWTRVMFGDDVPIFTKLLRTRFPPFVHMGFVRAVTTDELLTLLGREQLLLRKLFARLVLADHAAFDRFQKVYAGWAIEQSVRGYRLAGKARHTAFVRAMEAFVLPSTTREELATLLAELRDNRRDFVALLNVADLREELDSMLLSEAGIAHAIFGLSHQTHPIDRAHPTLQRLFGRLRERAKQGDATEDDLLRIVSESDLAAVRALNVDAPKSEAWMPIVFGKGKELVLVEPQQTSNTTLSFADFYTPFAWKEQLRFRKGDPITGTSDESIAKYIAQLKLGASTIDSIRRTPTPMDAGPTARAAKLFELVDEPHLFPFFTAHRVDLAGTRSRAASFAAALPDGGFHQLVVLAGAVTIEHENEAFSIDAGQAAFLPGSMSPKYALTSQGRARVLVTSAPVPRGNDPAARS